jgi:hypothetical protein
MEKEITIKDENQNDIVISVLGEFKIDALEKEFIMYSIVNMDEDVTDGRIIIGEVIRDNDNVQVVGIKEEEKELVLAFFYEITEQIENEDE